MFSRIILCLAALSGVLVRGQEIRIGQYGVQIHGFFSQGYAYSGGNNYLTMPTRDGSFAFTDGGLTVGTNLTDKLRVSAQVYSRNIGNLGRGQVQVDFANLDYRWRDYLGFRAGRVKSRLGLYNDSQDVESLHTWALLPQSVYPLDNRGSKLSHLGFDLYGDIPAGTAGTLSYDLFTGLLPADHRNGYEYGLAQVGLLLTGFHGMASGADLHFRLAALDGLQVGSSLLYANPQVEGALANHQLQTADGTHYKQRALTSYVQYAAHNWKLDGEMNQVNSDLEVYLLTPRGIRFGGRSVRQQLGWYTAAAYRFNQHLEIGTYHSRSTPNWLELPEGAPLAAQRVWEQAATIRIDINRFVDFKVEGHTIHGTGDTLSFQGFYSADNPRGLRPTTNLLVLRLGASF